MRNKVAKVLSGALSGYDGALIEIETDIKTGLPGLQIVGMGNKAIDEARQRVQSAIRNSQLTFPAQKVTVNLAPAELPKDGTHLDLPIALGVLVASGQLQKKEVNMALFAGELALDGAIRPIRGAVLLAELAQRSGYTRLFLPLQNVQQAQLVTGVDVIGISHLTELYKGLKGVAPFSADNLATPAPEVAPSPHPTIDDIIGHDIPKRALLIAAAGRHNILLSGSPGAGKTLLARALPGLLPPLSGMEITEVTKLHNLAHGDDDAVHTTPPLRAPHHSITLSAFIGGGLRPRPGEISLAHKGVLFLDELPEYPRATLEALRQPLEDRTIRLSRLYRHITYPADVLLVGTMNPCPCGYLGDERKECKCAQAQIDAYTKRLSGPLLDRIDLRVAVSKVNHEQFLSAKVLKEKQHPKVLALMLIARNAQKLRYKRSDFYNAYASMKDARQLFNITPEATNCLNHAAATADLTSRGYLRVLRVARTIADLEGSKNLLETHIMEALRFR